MSDKRAKSGNGSPKGPDIKEITRRFEKRFDSIESELGSLNKTVRGLRFDTKSLLEYVTFLDEEFQAHKGDPSIHSGV